MGREVRRVPPDWKHPQNSAGHDRPLYDQDFETAAAEWLANCTAWENGTHPDVAEYKTRDDGSRRFYWEWSGDPPKRDYYRPKWASPATHFQMYETVSEGTPISPVCASEEELAHWLADNKASAFGDSTAPYEQWLAMIRRGSAPSFGFSRAAGIKSGVEIVADPTALDHP